MDVESNSYKCGWSWGTFAFQDHTAGCWHCLSVNVERKIVYMQHIYIANKCFQTHRKNQFLHRYCFCFLLGSLQLWDCTGFIFSIGFGGCLGLGFVFFPGHLARHHCRRPEHQKRLATQMRLASSRKYIKPFETTRLKRHVTLDSQSTGNMATSASHLEWKCPLLW